MIFAALLCLTESMYFEGRNQSMWGQVAIGHVVENRVDSPRFPDHECEVVHQKDAFSYFGDGKSETYKDENAHARAFMLAIAVKLNLLPDPTMGSLHYHADYVHPHWADGHYIKIDDQLFYAGVK